MDKRSVLLAAMLTGAACIAAAGTGDLDPTFGSGGIVTTAFPPPGAQAATEILVQPDGRLVAVGVLRGPINGGGIGVARYLADGSLDPSFGSGGLVSYVTGLDNGVLAAGLLQPDGKIVASIDVANGPQTLFIVRYNGDGTPDTGFGTSGQIVLPEGSQIGFQSMVVHQGKLLVSMATANVAELRRFELSDGSPDTGFGAGGVVAPALATGPLVVQPDDKVLIAGPASQVARVNADGSPDASFGSGGLTSIPLPPPCSPFANTYTPTSLVLQPDGTIVLLAASPCEGIALIRYLPDGDPDPSFGMGGLVTSRPVGLFAEFAAVGFDLVLEPDGRLVVVGLSGPDFQDELLVAQFDPDGALDRTFGAGGRSVTPLLGRSYALAAARQADGKLVIAANGAYTYFVVARYDLACPALPDADGDGLGDACDTCTDPVVVQAPNVKFTHLAAPAGDEIIRLAGRLTIPLTPPIDPTANGMQIALYDGSGAEMLYAVLDPLAIVPDGFEPIWRANHAGTTHTFEPGALEPPAGIDKVSVRVIPSKSQVKFKAWARQVTAAVAPGQIPLELRVTLDARRSVAGQCGRLRFEAPNPVCVFSPSGNVLTCR